jgi:DNA-directed RNA polymerase specialized sigma24 family protein
VRGSSASRIRDLIERVAGDDSGGCRGGLAPQVARLIAGLVRIVRDVGLAENLAQDALVAALTQWREIGDPDHPWGLAVTRSSWATLTQCSRDGALRCSDTPNVAN